MISFDMFRKTPSATGFSFVQPSLESKQLVLRSLQLPDTQEVFRLRSEKEVNRYIPRAPFFSTHEAVDFVQAIQEGISSGAWMYWGIRVKPHPRIIGTICLWNFSNDRLIADVGYEMLPEFFGNGYMSDAMKLVIELSAKMGMRTLRAHTLANNMRSVRLLQKFDFKLIVEPESNLHLREVVYELRLSSPTRIST